MKLDIKKKNLKIKNAMSIKYEYNKNIEKKKHLFRYFYLFLIPFVFLILIQSVNAVTFTNGSIFEEVSSGTSIQLYSNISVTSLDINETFGGLILDGLDGDGIFKNINVTNNANMFFNISHISLH